MEEGAENRPPGGIASDRTDFLTLAEENGELWRSLREGNDIIRYSLSDCNSG